MIKKVCPACGKVFYAAANAKKYCSIECSRKINMLKTPPTRNCICKGCGNSFATKRRKAYCSNACRLYANGRGVAPKAKKEAVKPRYTLSQIAAMANSEGMTYGTYVQKYNL